MSLRAGIHGVSLRIPIWVPVAVIAVIVACGPDAQRDVGAEQIRDELRSLIEDVPASTAHQYQLRDTDGRPMGPMDVIWSPEAEQFAAVHFTWEDSLGAFVVRLATSDDLFTWEERQDYSVGGSQPSVARTPGGGTYSHGSRSPTRSTSPWSSSQPGTTS